MSILRYEGRLARIETSLKKISADQRQHDRTADQAARDLLRRMVGAYDNLLTSPAADLLPADRSHWTARHSAAAKSLAQLEARLASGKGYRPDDVVSRSLPDRIAAARDQAEARYAARLASIPQQPQSEVA
jgi:hypothetical protein